MKRSSNSSKSQTAQIRADRKGSRAQAPARLNGGLDLRQQIWQWIAAIPPGRVATYGQIARLAGVPRHARYVGSTLKNLPKDSALPWFRVLRGTGELAFAPGGAPWKRQKALLENEGVPMRGMKVALREYQWEL
ncbi:MAG: MGMT family protein [Pseudomonadales bacterium]|jgi:methylated-DNA-protein-cysteine methyltransferase-like protein|nr:MGMT family protein [Pseudomonadales bacterium]